MRWSVLRDRVWPELRQTWPFFMFFVGPMVARELARLGGWWLQRGAADQVRYFGTWLQLFGVALVATGVRELRRDFNRPTVFAAMRGRVAAIVASLQPRHHHLHAASGSVRLSASVATLVIRGGGTVEQRLDRLERDVDALRQDASERERKMHESVAELRAELAKEEQARMSADVGVAHKLENVAVGGLHLEVVGLWWLLAATIATTVPDGVAWVFNSLSVYF